MTSPQAATATARPGRSTGAISTNMQSGSSMNWTTKARTTASNDCDRKGRRFASATTGLPSCTRRTIPSAWSETTTCACDAAACSTAAREPGSLGADYTAEVQHRPCVIHRHHRDDFALAGSSTSAQWAPYSAAINEN